jgi:RNA polymerase sigma factor (sigma-70 family)
LHRRREQERYTQSEGIETESQSEEDSIAVPPDLVQELEREQVLREALANLPPRCRALVRMLFLEDPPRPYQQVAESLGLATGSIGFIRSRCLHRLRKHLEEAGFDRI